MRCELIAVLASVAWANLAAGQMPQGYHLGTPSAAPDTLVEVLANGRFRSTIRRNWRSDEERQLISTAERLYSDTDVLLAIARDAKELDRLKTTASGVLSGGRPNAPPRPAGNPMDRWWYDDFDNTWLPFAVTGAAVDYYLGRIRDIAAGRGQFTYARGQTADRATFEYTASARRDTSAGRAYVVELRLTWTYWCGPLCAVSFTHTRTVSFDRTGAVVGITGDARPHVIVS
jgi:hypothetical protein